jgi:hypothetical protein
MNPLFNFKNKYIAVHPPLFMAGIQSFYTQWRDVFYGYYPQTNTVAMTGLQGDGTPNLQSGVVTAHPMLQNNVIFTCLDTNGVAMILIDYPIAGSTTSGYLGLPNQTTTVPSVIYGNIEYVTGQFSVSWPNNTQPAAPIFCENIAYQPGKPLAMLYYDDVFTIRPVPDNVYSIQIEVDTRPTELLSSSQSPDLEQWWQYIAYGASLLIFQDRMDLESVQQIMPEYNRQERMVLRTTLTQ